MSLSHGSRATFTVNGVRVAAASWSLQPVEPVAGDGDLLLRAILAHPDEDTPRLVYADWLDENGQAERAEFVRVQVELARLNPPVEIEVEAIHGNRRAVRLRAIDFGRVRGGQHVRFHAGRSVVEGVVELVSSLSTYVEIRHELYREWPRVIELRARSRELLADPRNFVNWAPAIMHTGSGAGIRPAESGHAVDLTGEGFAKAEFRRGFVDRVTCTAAAWLEHADALCAACPVTRVALTTLPDAEVDTTLGSGTELVASLFGRDRWHTFPRMPAEGLPLALLKLEWPRVTFEVPNS